MQSTKKITSDILSSRVSSPSSKQMNKREIQTLPPMTNNGFLRGNSSPQVNPYENLKEKKQSLDQSSINYMENLQPPNFHCDSTPQQFSWPKRSTEFRQNHNKESKTVLVENNTNIADAPVEIVQIDNGKKTNATKTYKKEPFQDRELSNLQDFRIRENPLTSVAVTVTDSEISETEKSKVVFPSDSKFKYLFSAKQLKRGSSLRKSTKCEKYLTCALIVLIIGLSVILLTFLVKSDCLGLEKKVCLTEECVRTDLAMTFEFTDELSSGKSSSLLAAMDLTANPCHDFFQFACGTWNKKHVIPEDRSSISTFEVLADQLQVILKGVLEEPFGNETNESATKKAKLFYKSCMNVQQIRTIGDAPLREVLKKLGGWPVATSDWKPPNFSIETLLGKLRGDYNEGVLVEQWVGPDDKNSSVHILQLDQMQLALPSRDYYLKSSSEAELRAYHRYMTQVAVLLGANSTTAATELEDVVKFEIKLANATLPEADRHDTSAIYKKLPLQVLQKEVPELNWREYLSTFLDTTIQKEEPVVTYSLPYFIEMGKILRRTDRRVVHNYVVWRLIMKIMPHMIDEYQQKIIEFRKILLGILSERHRWSQCVEWTNKKLGMAVGALFIRDNFNQDSKETALEMIHTIREAFNELLAENGWMDEETRAVAKEKADSMNERIGYPELLTNEEELNKEYLNLTVTEGQFLTNVLNVLKYDAYHNLQKLRQPVNKDKWSTEPAVVNAFYNPNKNDIVFPAGILQPLFYSQHFPKSLNYGGIGVVIGHEITHGFDDKGRQFDKDGNMMQWWNNATIKAFRERTQCIIDQYSRYKLDEIDLFVNGRMTQGENIADNGGLKQSFRAYKKWVAKHGEEPLLPGINLTHDQLFFLNYAQIWCGSMRPEDALTKIRSSVHSPGPVRVLGPLSNSWDFAEAYKCPPQSPMNPTSKCSVCHKNELPTFYEEKFLATKNPSLPTLPDEFC